MTVKTKTALRVQATATLPDNTTGLITPEVMRNMVIDTLDSTFSFTAETITTTPIIIDILTDFVLLEFGASTITLPDVIPYKERNILFINRSGGNITLNPDSGFPDTINGLSSFTVKDDSFVILHADGANNNWIIALDTKGILIDNLVDVDTTTIAPVNTDILKFDGTNWVPVTAPVENATHTGDVTGSGALTIDKTAITGKSLVTGASGDYLLITDSSDSNNLKRVNASDFLGGALGSIDDHTDVDTATAAPAVGELLEWDGSNWIPAGHKIKFNATFSSGGNLSAGSFIQMGDVSTSATHGWIVPHDSSIEIVTIARTDSDAADVEILVDGTVEVTVATAATSVVDTTPSFAVSAGEVISLRNKAGGNTMSNAIVCICFVGRL